jgi:hypothetical protein
MRHVAFFWQVSYDDSKVPTPARGESGEGSAFYVARVRGKRETGMSFCPNCGSRVQEDARFCRECGQPIQSSQGAQAQSAQTPPTAPPQTTPPQPEKPKKKKRRWLWFVLGVPILLVLCVAVVMLLPSSDEDDATPTAQLADAATETLLPRAQYL